MKRYEVLILNMSGDLIEKYICKDYTWISGNKIELLTEDKEVIRFLLTTLNLKIRKFYK